MSKHLVIFIALLFCVCLAFGEDLPNATAQEMLTSTTTYVNTHTSAMNWNTIINPDADPEDQITKKESYLTDLRTDLEGITAETTFGSNVDPSAYVSGAEAKVQQMLGQFDAAENEGTLRKEYLEKTVNLCVQGYVDDMKSGAIGTLTSENYLVDFDTLKNIYQNRLDTLNSEPEATADRFDPGKYLDRATSGAELRNMKIQTHGFPGIASWKAYHDPDSGLGGESQFANKKVDNIMDLFQNEKFSGDGVAQVDFDYLNDLWPNSAEAYLMNTSYTNGDYYLVQNQKDADGNTVQVSTGTDYRMNEYGQVMSSSDENYNSDQFNYNGNEASHVMGEYNNRTWGYSNGTKDIVSITTNKRRYVVQEHFFTSPLVFDLDGDGAIEASNGEWMPHRYNGARVVEFDIRGDGFINLTEWVGANDGLLIAYNGQKEVSANDLFGTAGGFTTGYEKLSLLDANKDKQISGDELSTLSVWQDKNVDGIVDQGEITKVQDMGITSISLNFDNQFVSKFVQNGKEKRMVDWFPMVFVVKKTR